MLSISTTLRLGSIVLDIIVLAISTVILWLAIRFVLNRRYLRTREMVWLEITPPATVAKTPEAIEQLFSVIHGHRAARSLKERLLGRAPVMSFEITSTKKSGVRYLVQVECRHAANMQKAITSYISDSKVRAVERENGDNYQVVEFRETGHYVLPLATNSVLEQRDPLSYVIGAMTRLNDDEEIILQLVAKPTHLREAEILSHKILGNENILQYVSSKNLSILGKLANFFGKISSGATDLIGEVQAPPRWRRSGSGTGSPPPVGRGPRVRAPPGACRGGGRRATRPRRRGRPRRPAGGRGCAGGP